MLFNLEINKNDLIPKKVSFPPKNFILLFTYSLGIQTKDKTTYFNNWYRPEEGKLSPGG